MRFVSFVVAVTVGAAQVSSAYAQDCSSYALFRPGASMTTTNLNPKGKETGRTVTTTKASDGARAEVHAESVDAKGKPLSTMDYTATCAAGSVSIDMNAFLPQEQLEAYRDYDMSMQSSALLYPGSLAAGQKLDDGAVSVTFTMKDAPPNFPMAKTTMDVTLSNRTVVGPEPITTPAGTFDAWKIEYDSLTKLGGAVPMHFEVHVVEWYVPGIGAVNTETWRAGKLVGTTQLTALN